MSDKTGAKALAGKPELINAHIFEAVDHDREITGNGTSIMCYDPEADKTSEPLWQHTSVKDKLVPAGHEVEVLGATVKFKKKTG